DVYSLGVVLYELVTGTAPHAGLSLEALAARVVETAAAPVASRVDALPVRFAELIDACLALAPRDRPANADVVCDRLETVLGGHVPVSDASPYRGLAPFDAEHRALFFGRADDARAVVDRVRAEPFVIVAGDSGAGKSSLCRAAVLPAFAERSIAGMRWRTATMTPGLQPRATLAAVLAQRTPGEGLVIFVDQFEELISIADPGEAAEVAVTLADLIATTSNVRILASARSDFLGRLAALPELGELIGRGLGHLGPLSERGLREAITGPAHARGFELAGDEMIAALVASGRRNLPLLQFTLAELWEARDEKTRAISAAALDQIGGVAGALARRADQVMAALEPDDRTIAWRVFLRLMTAEGTRAVTTRRELAGAIGGAGAVERVIERLGAARLLAIAGDEARVEVVDEALFTAWPRLALWRSEHEHDARMRDQLAEAARRWTERGEPRGLLWRDDPLLEYRRWRERWLEPLTAGEQRFGDASIALARRTRRSRWFAVALVIAGLSIASGLLYRSALETRAQRAEADRQNRRLLVREGERELVANHPARALVYFTEVLAMGEDTPAVRFLIARAFAAPSHERKILAKEPHGHIVIDVSADGRFIASLSREGGVRVFDAAYHPILEVILHADELYAHGFSPDSRWYVAGDDHGVVHVWNTATWERNDDVLEPKGGLVGAVFSPDSKLVALNSTQRVMVFELATRRVIRTVELGTDPWRFAMFSSDSTALLVANIAGTWRWTAVADGKSLGESRFVQGYASMALATTLGRVYVAKGTMLYAFDAGHYDQPSLAIAITGQPVNGIAIAPDESELVTTADDGSAKRWSTRDHHMIGQQMVSTRRSAFQPHYNATSKQIALVSEDNEFSVWDLVSDRIELAFEATWQSGNARSSPSGANSIAFAPDPRFLLAGSGIDLRLIELGGEQHRLHLPSTTGVFIARYSPDERDVLTGGQSPARIRRIDGDVPLATFDFPDTSIYAVAWAPDGHVFVGNSSSQARIYKRDGTLERELGGHHSRLNGAEFSADSSQLLTAEAQTSRLFDVRTGALVQKFEQPHGALSAHFLGTDQIITAGYDGYVRIFERATGKLVTDFGDPMTQFLDVAVRPHHPRVIAVAGHDGVVSLWDLHTHIRIAALSGHTRPVTTVSWSPDGALLASSADDGLVKIWDPDEMRELETINIATAAALDVEWNKAGDRLLTASSAGALGVDEWDASRDHHTLAELQAFVTAHVPYQLHDGVLFTSDLR
ncbi:MAG: hypothetical protein ABI678_04615, partial [Kofleriaceae bacterium]